MWTIVKGDGSREHALPQTGKFEGDRSPKEALLARDHTEAGQWS